MGQTGMVACAALYHGRGVFSSYPRVVEACNLQGGNSIPITGVDIGNDDLPLDPTDSVGNQVSLAASWDAGINPNSIEFVHVVFLFFPANAAPQRGRVRYTVRNDPNALVGASLEQAERLRAGTLCVQVVVRNHHL